MLGLLQALIATNSRRLPALTLVTRGAVAAADGDGPIDPLAAMVWGLGRTIAREHPEVRCRCVDLNPAPEQREGTLQALVDELLADKPDEDQIGLRRGRRLVPRLVAARARPTRAGAPARAGASYLVTGGLSGIGLLAARRLAEWGRSESCWWRAANPTPGRTGSSVKSALGCAAVTVNAR